jgi:LPXTG-site transpeptidase (sortase) family protein
MNRFNRLLTVILIIVVVGAIVAFGFWIFDIIKDKQEEDAIADLEKQFQNMIAEENTVANTIEVPLTNRVENQTAPNPQPSGNTTQPGGENGGNSGGNSGHSGNSNNNAIPLKYKGYDVIGWINIPKTNVSYPILSKSSLSSMDVAPGWVYGPTETPSVNVIGNTVIYGHNYHNSRFFSNNKKLENGDYIYITSRNGEKVRYVIYNKYETSSVDFDYAIRKTENRREISLATCTDDGVSRLIIWAKEG